MSFQGSYFKGMSWKVAKILVVSIITWVRECGMGCRGGSIYQRYFVQCNTVGADYHCLYSIVVLRVSPKVDSS